MLDDGTCSSRSPLPSTRDGLPHRLQPRQQLQRGQCTDVTQLFFIGTLPWRISIIKNVIAWTITHLLLGWKPVVTGFWQHDGNWKFFCIWVCLFVCLLGVLFSGSLLIFSSFDFRILSLLGLFFCLQKARGIPILPYITTKDHFREKAEWIMDLGDSLTDRETTRWSHTEKCLSYMVKLRFFTCSI